MNKIHIMNPGNVDVQLRRYMDFLKFTDLLKRRSLWLTLLDMFPDKHEGVLPKSIRETVSTLDVDDPVYGTFSYEEWRKRLRELLAINGYGRNEAEAKENWNVGLAVTQEYFKQTRLRFQNELDKGAKTL